MIPFLPFSFLGQGEESLMGRAMYIKLSKLKGRNPKKYAPVSLYMYYLPFLLKKEEKLNLLDENKLSLGKNEEGPWF